MDIKEFIASYSNHPVLFVGTGFSLRYLENSFSWNELLEKVSFEVFGDDEFYYDIKAKYAIGNDFDLTKVAKDLEVKFNEKLSQDRNGKFKEINDIFYVNMRNNINLSRFKIYISRMLSDLTLKSSMDLEVKDLKKMKKNIASIITTNYDGLIEDMFDFNPLVGNDILLSNPYGSVYKIHGCASKVASLIITENDYTNFNERYELIRAQLLSLFIHNPIIFLGYSVSDENIKSILRTIFSYVEPNTEQANKIRSNFLLVEYQSGSQSTEVIEHDIDIEGQATIRINKIKTDNFSELYKNIGELHLQASAMDIRKVQSVFMNIVSGGEIKVKITEDLDGLENSEKILAIGSKKSINYSYHNGTSILADYFEIIEESNFQVIQLINEITIQTSQWFPMFGFSTVNDKVTKINGLKAQQKDMIENYIKNSSHHCEKPHTNIKDIYADSTIVKSRKDDVLLWNIYQGNLDLDEVEAHLKAFKEKDTLYRKILCFYDLKRYDL
ncbi:SIR2 family protein [Psychrobacter alimentarius]|uniref:SIR2 family protein n=1 Tax=Psychrobacter alimentarius TaxID=261164 RepID=UPI003FD1EC84